MRRPAIVALVLVSVLAVAQQLLLPPFLEGQGADRLERYGGQVRVALSAFPAARLLAGDGDSIEVTGSELRLDLQEAPIDAFERLDGFDEVRLALTDLEAGPLTIDAFELRRGEAEDAYSVELEGETSPRELARYMGGEAAGPLGSLLGDAFTGMFVPSPAAPVPLQLTAQIRSEDGRAEAERASGSVGGIPAGPLAEIVADAVVRRL